MLSVDWQYAEAPDSCITLITLQNLYSSSDSFETQQGAH